MATKTFATATFNDGYGEAAVSVMRVGKGFNWAGTERSVSCGYRTMPTVERAVSNARRDGRFGAVVVQEG